MADSTTKRPDQPAHGAATGSTTSRDYDKAATDRVEKDPAQADTEGATGQDHNDEDHG
jgi:hypothetical protein